MSIPRKLSARVAATGIAAGPPGRYNFLAEPVMEEAQRPEIRQAAATAHDAGTIAHFGHYEADLATGEVYWSPGVFEILGVDPGDGQPDWEGTGGFVHPEDRDEVFQKLAACQAEGDSYDFVHRVKLRNGTVRYVRSAARVHRSAESGHLKIVGTMQDITGHNRLRESLEESLERYAGLVEYSSDLIFLLDLEGRFLSCNSRAAQFGLNSGRQLAGRHIRDVYPPEVAARYLESVQKVQSQTTAVTFEHSLEEPLGLRYHRDTLYPLWRHGAMWAIGGICRDITDQKQAELALRGSEEKFRLLFEQTPLGYQSLDTDGRILDVNTEWLRILGYAREEVIGRPFTDFQSPTSRAGFGERFLQFKAAGVLSGAEVELLRKGGTTLTVLYNGRLSQGPQGLRTHCIFLDVTRHKRDGEALRKNAEILREMEGQGRIGFWEADLAGGRMYWSEEIFRLLDLDPAQGSLDFAESLERFGDRGAELEGCLLRVRDSQAREEQAYLVRLASGRQAWLHLDVNPAWNEHGEVNRLFGTMQDVTPRKILEEELARQNFELTQKNIALRELIDQVQHEKAHVEERIAESVQRLLLPLLARIKDRTSTEERALYQLVESTIRELVPMAGTELNGAMRRLSSRETEICLMIRNGLSSKEIGKLLGISIRSVETHRNNIRKKLGIGGSRSSLADFLRSQRPAETT